MLNIAYSFLNSHLYGQLLAREQKGTSLLSKSCSKPLLKDAKVLLLRMASVTSSDARGVVQIGRNVVGVRILIKIFRSFSFIG